MSESAKFYRSILENMNEGLQILDSQWRYIYVNHAAASHGRRSQRELLGRRMTDLYPGIEETEMFRKLSESMAGDRSGRFENEFTYPDGESRWFDIHVEPVDAGILVRSLDITDRKKSEARYRHAQKMEAIGRLAGGIAHDFNNTLAAIMMYADIAREKAGPEHPAARAIAKIWASCERASTLTRQLLAFARKQPMNPQVINICEHLDHNVELFKRILGEEIDVVVNHDAQEAAVHIDPSQLEQVIMNLVVNARDAMPDGGTLTLTTECINIDENSSRRRDGASTGPHVALSVTDTGTGMSRELQAKIFEPFFTTKERDKGTGLGLASVDGIVRQNGGHLRVRSEPGRGTAFELFFPRTDLKPSIATVSVRPADVRGSETVLLVEDDPFVRESVDLAVSHAGYEVISAENAKEAIRKYERHIAADGTVEVLLTDVVLPGMHGPDLAEVLSDRNPDLPVIYITGYTESSRFQRNLLEAASATIQKPVGKRILLEKLREVLDSNKK